MRGYRVLHQGYRVWWVTTAVGLCLAILLLIWYAQDPEYSPELVWNPTTRDGIITWVGLIGTTLSITPYLSSKNFFADDTEATIGDKLNSLDETLVHAASETAFVTFWVPLLVSSSVCYCLGLMKPTCPNSGLALGQCCLQQQLV